MGEFRLGVGELNAECGPTQLDAVILNAGVQYIFDFTKPESVDFNSMSSCA